MDELGKRLELQKQKSLGVLRIVFREFREGWLDDRAIHKLYISCLQKLKGVRDVKYILLNNLWR